MNEVSLYCAAPIYAARHDIIKKKYDRLLLNELDKPVEEEEGGVEK
ncbi:MULTISPECIES: hypothetical protein [Bacillaceae]|nr:MULTISPECIES: hypothetical protein [Bacillaceae]